MTLEPSPPGQNRRGFLAKGVALGAAAIACLTPAAAGLAALLHPLWQTRQSVRWVSLGRRMPSADGTPELVSVVAPRSDAWSRFDPQPVGAVFLRCVDGQLLAMQALCPHAGCRLSYDAVRKLFVCLCHQRPQFDLSGKRLDPKSRCPRDLDALEIERRGDEIWVNYETFRPGISQKIAET